LTYRLEDQADTRISRIVDLPNAREIIQEQDITNVYESHWFEESADFQDEWLTEPTPQ
jgi:hypothetical protein